MLSLAEWLRIPVQSVPFSPAATCISKDQTEGSLLNSQCAISCLGPGRAAALAGRETERPPALRKLSDGRAGVKRRQTKSGDRRCARLADRGVRSSTRNTLLRLPAFNSAC